MQILEFLNSIEKKTNSLVEERGLAAIPHKEVVNKILNYCQKQTCDLKAGDYKSFVVPHQIVKTIDIVENLEIEVNITDVTEDHSFNGSGMVSLKNHVGWNNNKIDYAKIVIKAYSYNGILFDRTILSSLYHELNHLYDMWHDLSKTGNLSRIGKSLKKTGDIRRCVITNDDDTNSLIYEIVYRLFSETELNALISNVYGDLQGMKSIRKDFGGDLKKTKAYMIYNVLKKKLSSIYQEISRDEQQIIKLRTYLETNGIFLNPYGYSERAYLKEFVRKTTYLLRRLYKGIGRVASLYYDTIEFEYPDVVVKTKWS